MPVNLELKARIASLEAAEARARAAGLQFYDILPQIDTYFRVANGRLKIREQNSGSSELIYYERTENTSERLSTYFNEPVADPARLLQLLSRALGVLAVVTKERRLYFYRGARVHLDTVQGLGSFVEFEVPAGVQGTEEIMKELRQLFGIDEADVIKNSYSDLIFGESFSPEA
jgi:predicted adenylyl cyclase CyaB